MLRIGRRMDKFLEQTSRNVNEEINTKYNIIKRATIEEVKPYVDAARSTFASGNALKELSDYLESAESSQTNIVDLNEYSGLMRRVLLVNIVLCYC